MLRNATRVTLLMLARGLIAPSDCVSLSRNFTNNHNMLPGIRAAGRASHVSMQHSTIPSLGGTKGHLQSEPWALLLPSVAFKSHWEGQSRVWQQCQAGQRAWKSSGWDQSVALGCESYICTFWQFAAKLRGKTEMSDRTQGKHGASLQPKHLTAEEKQKMLKNACTVTLLLAKMMCKEPAVFIQQGMGEYDF